MTLEFNFVFFLQKSINSKITQFLKDIFESLIQKLLNKNQKSMTFKYLRILQI